MIHKFTISTSLIFFVLCIATVLPAQEYDHNAFEKMIAEEHAHLGENVGDRNFNSVFTDNYDLKYCKMEWTTDPAIRYISGVVQLDFVPLTAGFNTINFDLHASMTVNSVTFNGSNLTFTQDATNHLLVITLPSVLAVGVLESIEIDYEGNPPNTGFGAYESTTVCSGNYNAMWTLSEPYGAKDWWPCKQDLNDKIDSIDVYVTCPSQYRAASNGRLLSEIVDGANTTYHWQHQHAIPAYLVAIAVAEYSVYSDFVPLTGGGNVEVLNYIYPCNLVYAQTRTPFTIDAMQLFNTLYIEYPYADEKYGHANFGWGGGMEHTTMSFMGGFSDLLISHELAHQWFGDYITCGSWEDIWLNEGFATYSEGMTYENGLSTTTWDSWKTGKINHVTGSVSGSVWVDDTTSVSRIFNSRLSYSKGALLLHMLRWKLGDADFFQAVQNYLNDPNLAYGYARTTDLQTHLETVSGQNLSDFFTQWFYGQGWPTYTVQWAQNGANQLTVHITQTQSHPSVPYFTMPVAVEFSDGIQSQTVVFDHQTEGQYFLETIPFAATTATFDPKKWLCAKSNISKNDDLLPLQLLQFEAKLISKTKVALSWQTINEVQFSHFEIERSTDGIHFEKIGSVEAQKQAINTKHYNYLDIITKETSESLFYRLKMVDEDGTLSLSFIKNVHLERESPFQFQIYPNPNTGIFMLKMEGNIATTATVLVYNTLGQLVYEKSIFLTVHQEVIELNISELPPGIYQISVETKGRQAVQTLYIE